MILDTELRFGILKRERERERDSVTENCGEDANGRRVWEWSDVIRWAGNDGQAVGSEISAATIYS